MDRIVRCRMLNATNDRCTGEALDPDGEVLICLRHAALVLELVVASGADMGLLVAAAAAVHEVKAGSAAARAGSAAVKADARELRDGVAELQTMVEDLASANSRLEGMSRKLERMAQR